MRFALLCLLLVSIFAISIPKAARAQDYKNQFTLTSDNDMYIDPNHDRYYSDGTYFNFSHAISGNKIKDSSVVKKILEFTFG